MKIPSIAALLLAASCATAHANNLTIDALASNPDTAAAFASMIKDHHLPVWISRGGVSSPARDVTIDGNEYQVLQSCKPHYCGDERIAIIYSAQNKTMSGVYSQVNQQKDQEKLQWLNITDDLSIDGKAVLYSALTGSLENHPTLFNN